MSILEKTLCYGSSKSNIPNHDHSNFLYLFKTKPDNENELSYIKVGMTEKQTLHGRFGSYNPSYDKGLTIYPEHIYYIHTDNIRLRELLIKRVFNKHPKIRLYYNQEYFEGPFELFVKIFQTIGLIDNEVLSKYSHIDKSLDLLNIILSPEIVHNEEDYNRIEQVEKTCPKCGRLCRGNRGYSIHVNKCTDDSILNKTCSYCDEVFSSVHSKDRHLGVCLKYHLFIQKQEYENKIEEIKSKCSETIQDIRNEQTSHSIDVPVISCTNKIYSELINKIMTLDKETEESIQTRILEEKDKWIDKYNTDIKTRDDRISKLEEENQFLRTVVGKLGLLSESADTYNKEDDIFQYTGINPMEYVYIIQEREFVKEGRPLYKIGRTSQKPYQRFSSYPKGSIEFMCMSVSNSKIAEGVIKKLFMSKFKQDRTIGVEYFEGDVEEMKKEFISLIDIINQKSSTN